MGEPFDRSRWYECSRCDFRSKPGDPTTVCPRCGRSMHPVAHTQE